MHPLIPVWYKQNLLIIKSEKVFYFFLGKIKELT